MATREKQFTLSPSQHDEKLKINTSFEEAIKILMNSPDEREKQLEEVKKEMSLSKKASSS